MYVNITANAACWVGLDSVEVRFAFRLGTEYNNRIQKVYTDNYNHG